MSEDFWNQFWPQFWGGVASGVFLAVLTLCITYIERFRIAKFLRKSIRTMKKKMILEEEKIKAEFSSKQ